MHRLTSVLKSRETNSAHTSGSILNEIEIFWNLAKKSAKITTCRLCDASYKTALLYLQLSTFYVYCFYVCFIFLCLSLQCYEVSAQAWMSGVSLDIVRWKWLMEALYFSEIYQILQIFFYRTVFAFPIVYLKVNEEGTKSKAFYLAENLI